MLQHSFRSMSSGEQKLRSGRSSYEQKLTLDAMNLLHEMPEDAKDWRMRSVAREGESELLVWSAGARCGAGWPRAEARASGDG